MRLFQKLHGLVHERVAWLCDPSQRVTRARPRAETRWIELLKDYYSTIEYHLDKVNVFANALSRKSMTNLRAMFTKLSLTNDGGLLAELQVRPTLVDEIRPKQSTDESLTTRLRQVKEGMTIKFSFNFVGVLYFCGRYCVPDDRELRQSILREAHSSTYAIHLGWNKMYRDLRELYWWPGLKQDVIEFVSKCLTCHQVKAKHQFPSGLLTRLYISELVRLHGVLLPIISNWDPRFTSQFWKKLHEALVTQFNFSLAFHPQSDG
ncbi:integrase [Gossypium australe]|uniref:Integrase n=1 Tax=Gossypium australe TaxID=47621 RepID=A0A5B6VNF1_9ROSI|nr:integrase [Gossypium australe]